MMENEKDRHVLSVLVENEPVPHYNVKRKHITLQK